MPLKKQPSLNILFIAAEAEPFVKVGGLGDYAGSLPKALLDINPTEISDRRPNIRLVIPFHSAIPEEKFEIKHLTKIEIRSNKKLQSCDVFIAKINKLIVYLIKDNEFYINKEPVYSSNALHNINKYALFSIACIELAKRLKWRVDVLHANDWHTALAIVKVKQQQKNDPFFEKIRTVLSLHNLGYMGGSTKKIIKGLDLHPISHPLLPHWANDQPLPMGLALSDLIIAVSPTYAKEIQTPQFGYGMQKYLRTRKKSIIGILNGIDYKKWDPQTDKCLDQNFSLKTISSRVKNKDALQKSLQLIANPSIPLIAIISRLDYQKGIDIALKSMVQLKDLSWQLVILGTGNQKLENICQSFADKNPGRVKAVLSYDDRLARRIYSSADIILIPSRYEPCGTTQMIAMRYGCLPLARATGGLKDSIEQSVNGFLFEKPNSKALSLILTKVLNIYLNNPEYWRKMQENAMQRDFTWNNSAREYMLNYLSLMN